MNTAYLLMARYDARAFIPIELVQKDFFPHLSLVKLVGKLQSGEIPLPMVRIEPSQKAARGVHVSDLAAYIDRRRELAQTELRQMGGALCTL